MNLMVKEKELKKSRPLVDMAILKKNTVQTEYTQEKPKSQQCKLKTNEFYEVEVGKTHPNQLA